MLPRTKAIGVPHAKPFEALFLGEKAAETTLELRAVSLDIADACRGREFKFKASALCVRQPGYKRLGPWVLHRPQNDHVFF